MARHALDERAELVETLSRTDPAAATLCGGWNAAQLAAHLVLRERSATELLGRLPSARLRAVAQRNIDGYVAGHRYADIVTALGAGPPALSPMSWSPLRESVNLLEYVVHHEDVRRAAAGWAPRELPAERQEAVWARVRLAARLTLRSMPVPLRLVWPGHGGITVGRGQPRVTVAGDPVELALLAFGRQRVARVDYEGEPADVAAVRDATIAI